MKEMLFFCLGFQEEVDKLGTKSHVSSSAAKYSEEINLEEVKVTESVRGFRTTMQYDYFRVTFDHF